MIIRYVCRLIGGISVAKNHIRDLEMGAARERHRSISIEGREIDAGACAAYFKRELARSSRATAPARKLALLIRELTEVGKI